MNQIHGTMKAMLESAVDDELIAKNPMAKMKAPRIDTEKRNALSLGQVADPLCALDRWRVLQAAKLSATGIE